MPISYRVMKTHEFNDSIFYRIACDCTESEHDVRLELEIDDDKLGILTMRLMANFAWASYYANTWYGRFWERVIASIKMLLTGKIEVCHEILFLQEDHINEFISAMEEGKQKMKKAMAEERM